MGKQKGLKDLINEGANLARILAEANHLLAALRDELDAQRTARAVLDSQIEAVRAERAKLQAATDLVVTAAKKLPGLSWIEEEIARLQIAIINHETKERALQRATNDQEPSQGEITNWS